jgi:hypothetical protein
MHNKMSKKMHRCELSWNMKVEADRLFSFTSLISIKRMPAKTRCCYAKMLLYMNHKCCGRPMFIDDLFNRSETNEG